LRFGFEFQNQIKNACSRRSWRKFRFSEQDFAGLEFFANSRPEVHKVRGSGNSKQGILLGVITMNRSSTKKGATKGKGKGGKLSSKKEKQGKFQGPGILGIPVTAPLN
jgi:hypothetical protein